MTLGYDDVMFLLRLLLGTGQRILLEVQAVEPLRLAGPREREGEGKASKATQSCCCLSPLSTPPEPSTEGTLGTALYPRTCKAEQLWSGGEAGSLPSQREKTLSLPRGIQGAGARGRRSVRAGTHPTHTPRRGGQRRPPPPQTLLPYLPEGEGSASKLLPIPAPSTPSTPSTPLGSL